MDDIIGELIGNFKKFKDDVKVDIKKDLTEKILELYKKYKKQLEKIELLPIDPQNRKTYALMIKTKINIDATLSKEEFNFNTRLKVEIIPDCPDNVFDIEHNLLKAAWGGSNQLNPELVQYCARKLKKEIKGEYYTHPNNAFIQFTNRVEII